MKKQILTLVFAIGLIAFANAQYKPESGFAAEVNFVPFSLAPIQTNNLKGRLFLNESMAVRIGMALESRNITTNVAGVALTDPIEETIDKSFLFGLTPGFEFHFGGHERLSPYAGVEFGFATKSSSTTINNWGNVQGDKFLVSGMWDDFSNRAFSAITFNLLAGVDYYIYKGLYFGAEIGLGLTSFTFKKVKIDITDAATSITVSAEIPEAKESIFNDNFVPAIRLGWKF